MLDPNAKIAGSLTAGDVNNMLAVLAQGTYKGLAEAEVVVVLAHKLKTMLEAAASPPPAIQE